MNRENKETVRRRIQKDGRGVVRGKRFFKSTREELGITPQILTRWRRKRVVTPGTPAGSRAQFSQEQQ